MSIFDFLADILFRKNKNSLSNIDSENTFSPFMINRWASMYSNTLALKCNLVNKFLVLDKKLLFSLFINVFDKVPTKKITYFKKNKDKTDENNRAALYSNALEISQREINQYIDILNSTTNSIK